MVVPCHLAKTEGFIRLVTTNDDNVVIGAQIGGVGASDMVSELALAIESGMNAGRYRFNYPSTSIP